VHGSVWNHSAAVTRMVRSQCLMVFVTCPLPCDSIHNFPVEHTFVQTVVQAPPVGRGLSADMGFLTSVPGDNASQMSTWGASRTVTLGMQATARGVFAWLAGWVMSFRLLAVALKQGPP
jgi:hypothetical protein